MLSPSYSRTSFWSGSLAFRQPDGTIQRIGRFYRGNGATGGAENLILVTGDPPVGLESGNAEHRECKAWMMIDATAAGRFADAQVDSDGPIWISRARQWNAQAFVVALSLAGGDRVTLDRSGPQAGAFG